METIEESYSGNPSKEKKVIEPATCFKSPEWAEHARFKDDDHPCDDGRTG